LTTNTTDLFGDRLNAQRVSAMHKLSRDFDKSLGHSASDSMRDAGMMFGITKHPQFVRLEDGTELPTKSYAVVRDPIPQDKNPKILATVGKDWTTLQAEELGAMLDPIAEQYPVEATGWVGDGQKIYLTLDAGETQIAGEEHNLYWLIADHRDGNGSLSMAFTPVRLTCMNALVTGLKQSKVSVSIKHNKQIHADTSFYLDIFNQMARTQDSVVEAMNSMSRNKLIDEEIESIINYAYPSASLPTKLKLSNGVTADDVPSNVWKRILNDKKEHQEEWEKRQGRIQRIRDNAMERFNIFNEEFPKLANTSWGVYNAIVETEDYRRGHDASATALFGSRAESKARAFNKALELV